VHFLASEVYRAAIEYKIEYELKRVKGSVSPPTGRGGFQTGRGNDYHRYFLLKVE